MPAGPKHICFTSLDVVVTLNKNTASNPPKNVANPISFVEWIIQELWCWWVEPLLLLWLGQFGICKHSSCFSIIFLSGGRRGIFQAFLGKPIKWSIVHKRNSSGLQNKHPFHQILGLVGGGRFATEQRLNLYLEFEKKTKNNPKPVFMQWNAVSPNS